MRMPDARSVGESAAMMRDLAMFLPATFSVVWVPLAVFFPRIGAVVLPRRVVVLSRLATLGVVIALGIPASAAVP